MKSKDIESNPKPRHKGLQVNASVAERNVPRFRALATESVGPKRDSAFAGVVLNLVVECVDATKMDWDTFKVQLPGYQQAMSERRRRAVVEALTAPPTVKERYDSLPSEVREELEAKLREIDARKKPTKSKSKAG